MKKDLLDLASWAIEISKKAGANDCWVRYGTDRFVDITYRDRKPEKIQESSSRSITIGIYIDNRYSVQHTSDIRKSSLEKFIANAIATTKLLAEDPYRSLTDPKYFNGIAKVDLGLVDSGYSKVTPEKRHALVKAIENACLDEGGSKVISVTAGCFDSYDEYIYMTSNGFSGYKEETDFWAGAEMTAKDKGDRRPSESHWIGATNQNVWSNPEEIGRVTARRTLSQLGSKKIPTGAMPIIVENRIVSRLLAQLIAPLYGQNIQQKRSFLEGELGQKIGSDKFTLTDDPLLVGGLGSRLYDADGIAAKKRTIVEEGVLKNYFIDWYYSRKLGCEPTTGAPSNLTIPPGKQSIAEIIKAIGRGILITDFIGGNSNSTTGDFSIGIFGQYFENGSLVHPFAEMNIAGNHLQIWNRLLDTANDPWVYSSYRTPSLVFDNVMVSGK